VRLLLVRPDHVSFGAVCGDLRHEDFYPAGEKLSFVELISHHEILATCRLEPYGTMWGFRARDQAPGPEGSARPHRRRRANEPREILVSRRQIPSSSFTGDDYEGHQQGSSRGVKSPDPGGVGTAGGHGPGPVRFYSATAQPHRGAARDEGAG